jgi:hypothetical protein
LPFHILSVSKKKIFFSPPSLKKNTHIIMASSGVKSVSLKTPISSLTGFFDHIGGRISVVKLPADQFDSKKAAQLAVSAIDVDKDALLDQDGFYSQKFNISANLSDQAPLKASLGTDNKHTFASVHAEKLANRQGYGFYLVTNTCHEAPAAAFNKWLSEQPAQFSVGDAIASPEYARVQQAADVNHRAVVARVLHSIGADSAVKTTPDTEYKYTDDAVVQRSLVAPADMRNMTRYGVIARGTGDTALIYHNALNVSDFAGDSIAVPLSFTDGVHLFKRTEPASTVTNVHSNSLPLVFTVNDSSAPAPPPLSADDMDVVKRVVHWKGKINLAHEKEISQHISATVTPAYVSDQTQHADFGLSRFVASTLETVALIPGGFGV